MKALLKYSLYRRTQSTNEVTAIGHLEKDSVIDVVEVVNGVSIDGISTWYKATDGFYYWGGGVEEIQIMPLTTEVIGDLNFKIPLTIDWNKNFLSLPADLANTKGQGITVAMLDTGVDLSHPNLANADIILKDFTELGLEGKDDVGHGTGLVGIMTGRFFNQRGINGVANKIKIISLKIHSRQDVFDTNYEQRIVNALDFLLNLENTPDILNLSFSFSESTLITSKLTQLTQRGCIVCAAAFNQRGWDNRFYPATLPITISVAAVNEFNMRNSTNMILAGADIVGPFISIDTCDVKANGFFGKNIGCSFTTAFISSCVALILSKLSSGGINKITVTKDLVLDQLKKAASDINTPGMFSNSFFGYIIK